MKIRGGEYKEIQDYLVEQSWAGNGFVVFPTESIPVGKDQIECFSTSYEAKEYCYEMSTDVDFYGFMATKSMYRTMSEALKDKSLLIIDAGLVDVSAMVAARQERLEKEQEVNNQNNKVMNENNFNYLKDQVKFTGFGDSLEYELKDKMKQQAADFTLSYKNEYGKDKVEATLNFKKSDEGDFYFFNTYDVKLQKEKNEVAMQQSFYVNNKGTITMKEAYNLMEGRAVNKDLKTREGEEYNVWIKLDFKDTDNRGNFKQVQYGKNYGFDLEAQLGKHPIKELTNEEYKKDLIDSLKKGNIQSATFIKDGQEVKQFIEANPQFKNINLYDTNMQRLDNRQTRGEKQGEEQQQSAKTENKKGPADEEGAGGQKERKRTSQRM
ncbi:MAG: hypothetical protein ACLGH8_15080 [Bacteroidia bacterium]